MNYSKVYIALAVCGLFYIYLYKLKNFVLQDNFVERLFKEFNVSNQTAIVSELIYIAEKSCRNEINKLNSSLAEKIRTPNYLFQLNSTTTCYEIDSKPVIWTYWDKEDNLPIFGRILTDSIQCVNPEFHVIIVHDSTLNDFWPDCPWDLIKILSPNHRSDVIRVNLLKIFGGIYLDIDTFALESFYVYYEMLKDYDLVGADWEDIGPVAVGFLGPARANHPFFNVWSFWQLECLKAIIRSSTKNDPFDWPEFSAYIAGPLAGHMIRNQVLKYYAYRGHVTVGQLVNRGLASAMIAPLSSVSFEFYKLTETPILFVHHSQMGKGIDNLNFNELMYPNTGHTVFSYFVKCALIQCYNKDTNDDFAGLNFTVVGKLPIEHYIDFVGKNPLPYPCYEFNGTILPKVTKL